MKRIDPSPERTLVFDWPVRHQLRPALALLLVVSLGIHAGALALFKIVYPVPEGPSLRHADVAALLPGSEQAGMLMPWLRAADPGLMSRTRPARAEMFQLPPLPYRPSYESGPPRIELLPTARDRVSPQARRPPAPVHVPVGPVRGRPPETLPPETQIDLRGGLNAWTGVNPPVVTGITDIPREPTELMVAVAPGGQIRHVFLIRGSGSSELDDAARRTVMASRLSPPAGNPPPDVTWGRIFVRWGADIHQPSALNHRLPE